MSCAICLIKLNRRHQKTIICGHTFHKACLHEWYKRSATCPLCRRAIPYINHSDAQAAINYNQLLRTIKMRKWERMRTDRNSFLICPLGIILVIISAIVFILAIMNGDGFDGLLILAFIGMATFIANCLLVLKVFEIWHPDFKREYLSDYKSVYGHELQSKCYYVLAPLPKPRQALV